VSGDKEPEKSYLSAGYPRNAGVTPALRGLIASVVGEEFLGFVESWLLA
jgi:hypothetical protein